MLTNLRELLNNEVYPHIYTHKFIGLHTPDFLSAVQEIQTQFDYLDPAVESRQSKRGDYIAYTFTFEANAPEEILYLIEKTSLLRDLKIIL